MPKISLMKPELANLIAAGEVIERPASVIKELVENSIDAEAKSIYIGVVDAGKRSITVKDDGIGMGREDASLCFLRHASSKIKNEYDLMRIHTLGFRGEAIPSIASISNIVLTTSDGTIGTKVESKPNKELVVSSAPTRKGTVFEITNLFYNVPARLKYLKSDRAENYAIIDICEKMALGFPNISFTLVIDGKTIFKTSGKGDLLETIQMIYGNNVASNLFHIEKEEPTFSFHGFISKPEINYSRKTNINIFLNNRYISDYVITKAISESYKDYLPPDKYPFATIFLDIDPAAVDVNVHPTKREVRMSLENDIAFSLQKEIYNTLFVKKPLYEVKSDVKANTIANYNLKDAFNIDDIDNSLTQFNEQANYKQEQIVFPKSFDSQTLEINNYKPLEDIKEETKSDGENYSYSNVFSSASTNPNFPNLYPIGQVLQTYIVCNSDDGFYLIDQHAAAERINFEKTEKLFEIEKSRIIPLLPIIISLTHKEELNLDSSHIAVLKELGVIIEKFGKKEIKVTEIPSFLLYDENSTIENIVHLCLNDEKVSLPSLLHLSIADIACKKSIKANHIMSITEIQGLLKDLSKCKNPANCPHGRPTMLKMTKYDVEKIFRRVGF